jgi:hypothetical protein
LFSHFVFSLGGGTGGERVWQQQFSNKQKKNKEIYQGKKKKKIYHNGMENGVCFSRCALEHNDVIPSSTGRQVKSRDTDSTANKKKLIREVNQRKEEKKK